MAAPAMQTKAAAYREGEPPVGHSSERSEGGGGRRGTELSSARPVAAGALRSRTAGGSHYDLARQVRRASHRSMRSSRFRELYSHNSQPRVKLVGCEVSPNFDQEFFVIYAVAVLTNWNGTILCYHSGYLVC
ncbi:unnamed protein product [Urochloa humidicola]